ncbi:MAG: BON domain-containing protein [Burkholderiaceae bacterium]|nr:BON domain-containing protein [Burkholderiaceae bacterium]
MGARPGTDAQPNPGTQPGSSAPGSVSPDPAQRAADASTSKAKDAMITTAINAELARDSKLSSLRIDVDTSNGNVALHGTAPDADSRERATQLASSVDGVKSVDNQLTVQR